MFPQLDDRLPSEWAPLHPYTPSDSTDPAAFPSPLGAASWGHDGFSHDPGFLASQEELRCMLFNIAQSAAPTRAPSPESHILRDSEIPTRPVLSNPRRIEYLKNYVGQVAPWVSDDAAIPFPAPHKVSKREKRDPWAIQPTRASLMIFQLDMFDSQCTFRVQIPALARSFPALLNAILAISARQMERKEGIQDSFDSLELYQEAIRLLSPLLQMRDPKVVAACVLLCCLEMMSARAQDWQRHLEGCAALFDAFEMNGFSSDILQAVFWCYARMGEHWSFFEER